MSTNDPISFSAVFFTSVFRFNDETDNRAASEGGELAVGVAYAVTANEAIEALTREAGRRGWLPKGQLKVIPTPPTAPAAPVSCLASEGATGLFSALRVQAVHGGVAVCRASDFRPVAAALH